MVLAVKVRRPCAQVSAAANDLSMMAAGVQGSGWPSLPAQLAGELVRAATAAPSMHNTQPWRFRVRAASATIELRADSGRTLPVGDPHGRAVHIACGAAVFNLRLAAAAAGLEAHVRLLPDPRQPLLVAAVRLSGGHRPSEDEQELQAAIWKRQTNREPFSNRIVPAGIRAELAEAAGLQGALLHFPDQQETRRLLHLVADAERDLLADPGYRAEVACWAGGQRDREGIPEQALGPRSPEGAAPVRDLTPGQGQRPVRYAWFEEHPQLAVLSVQAAGPVDWLRAGQALQRVWLTATLREIAVAPLTQPLETPDAWQVGDPQSGTEHPQMILRFGYGLPIPPGAPRRPVCEVLDPPPAGPDIPGGH